MKVRLRFNGFPDSVPWKTDQPSAVPGQGEIYKGEAVDVDDNTAEWLLSSKLWTSADADDAEPADTEQSTSQPATPPATQPTTETISPLTGTTGSDLNTGSQGEE